MRTRYCVVGRVTKTHGHKGAVVVKPQRGFDHPLRAGMTVALVPPALQDDRWQTISAVSSESRGQVVWFSHLNERARAFGFVSRWVLANVEDIEQKNPAARSEWVGLAVRDRRQGYVGLVRSVEVGNEQDLLVVESATGEVLIPAVAPILVGQRDRELEVDCPQGLLDLERARL